MLEMDVKACCAGEAVWMARSGPGLILDEEVWALQGRTAMIYDTIANDAH